MRHTVLILKILSLLAIVAGSWTLSLVNDAIGPQLEPVFPAMITGSLG